MRGIDLHVHPFTTEAPMPGLDPEQISRTYNIAMNVRTEDQMMDELRQADVKAYLIAFDCESFLGEGQKVTNEQVKALADRHPDVVIGWWATADPWKGKAAVQSAVRAMTEMGALGVKFQPAMQGFEPSDRRFFPLYDAIAECGGYALMHVGHTGACAGMPGGGGMILDYCHPRHVDRIAAEFPKLTIVTAHPAWPWQDEMNSIALHKGNVFMELSGWAPKYFPDSLKREIGTRLQDKVMFGSDWPVVMPQRWLDEFEQMGYKDAVVDKVLTENAKRILKIDNV